MLVVAGDADEPRPAFRGMQPPDERPVPWATGARRGARAWRPDGAEPEEAAEPAAAEAPPEPESVAAPEPEVTEAPEPEPAPEPPADPNAPCPRCEETREQAILALEELEEELREPYVQAAAALDRAADELSAVVIDQVVELARRLAAAVVQREVATDPGLLRTNVEAALRVAGPITAATLRCHPDDAEAIREMAPRIAGESAGRPVEITARPSDDVERGACIVLFEEGIVDARWSAQLDRLAEAARAAIADAATTGDDGGDG